MAAKTRYLLVGAGRSGSSLLAAIMADSGANFNMPRVEDWNAGTGAYEHPEIAKALNWYARIKHIQDSLLFNKLFVPLFRQWMLRHLRMALKDAKYVKQTNLHQISHLVKKINYEPSLIVTFRSFGDYARSRYLRFGWEMPRMIDAYIDTYSIILLQLQIFGGCLVSFNRLVDLDDTGWAVPLAELTGIAAEEFIKNRNARVKPRPEARIDMNSLGIPQDSERLNAMYQQLCALQDKVVKPYEG